MTTIEQQDSFSPFLPRSRRPYTLRDTPRLFLWRKQAAPQTKRIRNNELRPIDVNRNGPSIYRNIPGSLISSSDESSSDGPSTPPPGCSRSSWLQVHAQKGVEGHLAGVGSVDDFVWQETPNKKIKFKYYKLQVGTQRSLSMPEPHVWSANNALFVLCLPEQSLPMRDSRAALAAFPIATSTQWFSGTRLVHLSDPLNDSPRSSFPRDIEAEAIAWLDEASSATMADEDERPAKVVAAVIDERPIDIVADVRALSSTFLVSLFPRRFPFSLLSLFFRLLSSSFRFPFSVSLLSCRLSLLLPCVFVVIYLRPLDGQYSIFVFCKVLPGPCSIVKLILGRNPVNEPQFRELLFVSRNERS